MPQTISPLLAVALMLFITPAACLGQEPPPLAATTAAAPLDPIAELQQLEEAALALDPAAPDATARLHELLGRLARVSAQFAREVALLREAQNHRAAGRRLRR